MVNHLSFQDDTTEANKPAKKPRFKKYSKTRRKKVENAPSPKKTWWKKNSLYQLLCCQNTCYSVALYLALVLFIALFVYAVWKICDLRFVSKPHHGSKRPLDNKDHTSKSGDATSTGQLGRHHLDANTVNSLKTLHQRPVSTTRKPVTRHSEARTFGTTTNSYNAISERTAQNRKTSETASMSHLNKWEQDSPYQTYLQGDKRYMIPPSPAHLNYFRPFDGSGGSTVEEWRAMRLALLRKRLKLTTGSSYPTDNPYWKTVLAPKLTPGSPFFNPYFTDRGQTDNNIIPVHDDSIPNAIPLTTYSKTPTVKISPNIANTVSKHSEIQGINANSTFGKGYTKLLADLFSKMMALRNTKNTTTATGPSSFRDSYAKGTYSTPAALNIPSNKYNATSPGISNISDKNTGKNLQTANSLAGYKQSTNYSTLLNLTTTSKPVTTTVTARATETTKSAISVQGTPPQKSAQPNKNLSSDIDHNLALHRSKLRMSHKNPRYHSKVTRKEAAETSSIKGHKKHHSKVKTVKHNKLKKEKRHKLKNSGRPSKHQKLHRRGKVFEEKSVESSYNKASEMLGSGSGSIDYTASGSGIGSGIGMDSSSIISSGSGFDTIDHSLSSGWSSGDGHHNEGEYGRNEVTHTNRHTSKKAGAKKSYVGLRKTLIKLKKKHTKSKEVHSSKSEHHKKEKLHGTKSSRHHKLHKSRHKDEEELNVKKDRKHRSHKEKNYHDKKKKHSKHVESKKKHSNKHKYMKIIQQKLMRVKKKHQIARHLSKVQKKLAELEKRKKSKEHHKKHRTKASLKSKSLEMPARKHEIPKHWKMGVVKMKDCSILKQFDKRHYVGINLYKKEHNKFVYAVTDCTLKKGFHHRYKCRRLFYKTTGYMMLKRSENAIRSSEINLVFCRHKSSFNKIAERNVKDIKKATITPKKRNEDTDDNDYDGDDDDGDDDNDHNDDDDKTARKRSSISKDKSVSHSKHNHKKSKIGSNKHSNRKHRKSSKRNHARHHKKAKREHTKKHSKHNHHHHRGSRHSSKRIKHLHDDNEEITDSGDESGSGEDADHGSGDVEERFERSATSQHKEGGKKTRQKKKHAKSNHERKKGHKHVSAETTMYAKFFDMMKEMKQEIKNVTSVNVHVSHNATSLINKINVSKALEAESNSSVSAKQNNETKSDRQPTHKAQTTVHSTTSTTKSANGTKTASIQDMVAQIVPAIMKQFQSKDIMKANSISNDKKLMVQSTLATTSSTTITPKPTTKPTTVKTTSITTTKRPPTTAIRKARTQVHTPTKRVASHHTSVRHTTLHHHSTNHPTTKHVSKPKAKTTQAPNIALILKGLKALGISPITKHTPTKSPSIQQRSVIPSLARLKTPLKPKSPTRNTPTKQISLPAPIPKPLALHNPYQMHLLCFGDSLTAGYHNHGKAFSPYGNHLRQLINLSSKIPTTVEIKGIVGEMTHKQMAARLPEVLGNSSVFDWVIILGGTNDILHVKNFADDQEFLGQLENVWQPRITKDIEKLHDISHKYGAHSMLLTVPENAIESWPGYKILLNMRKKINNALRQYAAQHRDKVALCDIAQKLPRHSLTQQQETAFWDDHLHMTERGYSRMAEEVFKCLKAYIPKR